MRQLLFPFNGIRRSVTGYSHEQVWNLDAGDRFFDICDHSFTASDHKTSFTELLTKIVG